MPMFRILSSTIIATLALSGVVSADIIKLEGNPDASVIVMDNRPSRGMTQTQVLELYGEPVARNAPVGEPPISSWNYDGFSVFFEHNYVLHTVNHTAKRP